MPLIVYKQSVANAATFTSAPVFLGAVNGASALLGNPAWSLFVSGASATLSVALQVAYCPTPPDQSQQPANGDYIPVETAYVANTIKSFDSLSGLWARFVVINSGTSPATITASLQ